MALTLQGYWVSYELADNSGKTTRKRVQLRAADHDAAVTAEAAFRPVLMATTDLVLVSYQIEDVFAEDALTLPASGIQKEDQLLITMPINAHPMKSGTFAVPGAKATCFTATSGPGADIGITGGIVGALVAEFTPTGHAYISDVEAASGSGYRSHRRHVKNTRS